MNTTPSSPPHSTERALVLGGGGSAGNAWVIGVIAGLADAGLDVTTADLTIGTSSGSTTAVQIAGATPSELYAATVAAIPPQRPAGGAPAGGRAAAPAERPPRAIPRSDRHLGGRRRHAPPHGRAALEKDAASGGCRQARDGAPSSPPAFPTRTGRTGRFSSPRSMPAPANLSCSIGTAVSTWWTPSPRARPAAVPPTGSATAGTSTAGIGPTPRTPIWRPGTGACSCCRR